MYKYGLACLLALAHSPTNLQQQKPTAKLVQPQWALQTFQEKNTQQHYEIFAQIPQIIHPISACTIQCNKQITQYIEAFITKFKNDHNKYWMNIGDSINDILIEQANPTDFLDLNAHILYESPDYVSIYWQHLTYYYGAAHEILDCKTVTYSLAQQKAVQLNNIFKTSPEFFAWLKKYARSSLQQSIKQYRRKHNSSIPPWDELDAGLAMRFANGAEKLYWNLTPQGLLLTFCPYDVECYAAGYFKVLVPYELLKPFALANIQFYNNSPKLKVSSYTYIN